MRKTLLIILAFAITGLNSSHAQTELNARNGPVRFIKGVNSGINPACPCTGHCLETGLIHADAGDRFIARITSGEGPLQLTVSADQCKRHLLRDYDTVGHGGQYFLRMNFSMKKNDEFVIRSSETLMEMYEPARATDGLYVMQYPAVREEFRPDWAFPQKLNYILNQFYADCWFMTGSKIDSTDELDTWAVIPQIKTGYNGMTDIRNNRRFGNGEAEQWSCNEVYWLSDLNGMSQAEFLKEMAWWKLQFSAIKGLKKTSGGFLSGLEEINYEFTADKELARFSLEPVWNGYEEGTPGKLYFSLIPVKLKSGKYMFEVALRRHKY